MKKKLIALFAVLSLSVSLLAACDKTETPVDTDDTGVTSAAEVTNAEVTDSATNETASDTPLVVGYRSEFNMKFTPFFGENAQDNDLNEDYLGLGLISNDRTGQLILNGIEGETRSYNGTDYFYQGVADITIDIDDASNTTRYGFKLRDDLVFSDGTPITIDDIIFSFYVYCDIAYTGGVTLGTQPIQGLDAWRTQTSPEVYEKYVAIAEAAFAAGYGVTADTADFTLDLYNAFYETLDNNWKADVQAIVDYVANNYVAYAAEEFGMTADEYKADANLAVAGGMVMWGFGTYADGVLTAPTGATFDIAGGVYPTIDDYFAEIKAKYPTVTEYIDAGEQASPVDVVGNSITQFVSEYGSKDESLAGSSINSISGIRKINDYECEVITDGYDVTTIYQFGIIIAPLHHYGDKSLYKPEEGMYGFERGNMDLIHKNDLNPLGAGPYKYIKYDNKIVYLEANENYFLGAPAIKSVQLKEGSDADLIPGTISGVVDISQPSVTKDRYEEIRGHNSNGTLDGDKLIVEEVDYRGYGYIGLSATNISVGGDSGSEASKNLRKGLTTILSVYRDLTVDSYYKDTATVINYPITTTSWAHPLKTDPNYRIAYSLDKDGNDIFTSSMSSEDKYEAAKKAALDYFEAAGYTVADGKITAAPDGAKMSYEVFVAASGTGDHPSFTLLSSAKQALAEIGMELIINDVADANIMWNALSAGEAELWCAAWQSTVDPDMYQIYHSSNVVGSGSGDNRYMVTDDKLDANILLARTNPDQTFRKEIYKECFDIIMDWAVEVPVYQRKECTVYSPERIDASSMTKDITTMYSWMEDLNTIKMVAQAQ